MILCCGEALIDMLPRETAGGERAFAPHAGGSVFNSAVALGRLGAPASFFSGLSDDLFGALLQQTLKDARVGLDYATISSLPTTLAFVTLNQGQASYHFYDENSAGRMLMEEDLPALRDDVEALLFGGISLATEPCGGTYEALMAREEHARVTMLDPNVRPAFIQDVAHHKARMRRMMVIADIVKISVEDLAWLGDGTPGEAAQELLSKGVKLAIITSGGEGAEAFWKGGRLKVGALKVAVVDTVGAGDAFNAGVLAALRESGHLQKSRIADLDEAAVRNALEFATRVAAVTVSRAGANPPRRDEL